MPVKTLKTAKKPARSAKKAPVGQDRPASKKVAKKTVDIKAPLHPSSPIPHPLNVVCMWWRREDGSEKFSLEYVNRLYRMVQRNLTLPHRFVCFTEDAIGNDGARLLPEIERFPIPPVNFPKGCPERGWKKLGVLLSEKVGDLHGTALFLDLDTVIVDNIDDMFKAPGKFLIARDKAGNDIEGNSSVVRFEIGQHQDVLNYFENNFESVRKEVRREQQFLSNEMRKKGIFGFWNGNDCPMCKSWVRSFKYCCLLRFPFNWFVAPKLPKGAKIVVFHGRPINEEAMNGYTAKFGLRRVRPTKWIRKYWIGQ